MRARATDMLRGAIPYLPVPRLVDRLLRFYLRARAGESTGDMGVNGEFRFLDAHGPACRVMFDVGALDGVWTARALDVSPTAEIHCFEPITANFDRLVARGFPSRVICNPCGLSDAPGAAEIFSDALSLHDPRGPGPHRRGDSRSETVRLTTLDVYCADRGIEMIDFLKIDTEGHDLAVLRGGERMIREGRVLRIQFEYGPRNVYARVFLRDFFLLFEDLPYAIYKIMPRELVPVAHYDPALENLQYKNFAALHESVRALGT